jgi:hypothetical protein
MSKLGKKYTLSSNDTQKSLAIKAFLNRVSSSNIVISRYEENYNDTLNQYEGQIEYAGNIETLNALLNFKSEIVGEYTNAKFDIDTHYEELLELKGLSTTTGLSGTESNVSLADSVNLYKYKNLLEYNFLVKNYEDYLSQNTNISETALPYFFEVLSDFATGQYYNNFDGTQFFETPEAIITSKFNNDLKTNLIPYSLKIDDKKLRIDKYLEKFNIYKEEFPFYADITFDTHQLKNKSITSIIESKDLYTPMMDAIINNTASNTLTVKENNSIPKINVEEYDLGEFLKQQLDSYATTDYTLIFDINQSIDNKARTFLEVLEDKQEYSEVMGYHLKKYQGSTNSLLQEWYFPNVGESTFSWVDSQIKYNKLYTYKLDLIVLTFATRYNITDLVLQGNKLVLKFVNKPLIKSYILKSSTTDQKSTLGATYTNKLLDSPPMEPEVELVPYVGVDNKIKINFNTSTGKKTVPEVVFSDDEKQKNNDLKLAQNKDINGNLLTFQTDEPADSIDIYRLDYKPKDYSDFSNYFIKRLSTDNSAGASFIDDISPNKKYYYIARCADYHEHISNPTPIYELEIINDKGLIIPYINVVDFDKEEDKKDTHKEFKRYIKIQPALIHRLINPEKTDTNDIELGQEKVVPWNKSFKLRITSKSTGKKIDVNFRFKYNKPT